MKNHHIKIRPERNINIHNWQPAMTTYRKHQNIHDFQPAIITHTSHQTSEFKNITLYGTNTAKTMGSSRK